MPVRQLQRAIGISLTRIVAGTDTPSPRASDPADPGPIPLDSPVRAVHGDPAMLIGGVRALLFQTLHPDAMFAVAQHSDYRNDPLGRLQRTAHFIGATAFGSGTAAAAATATVNAIHSTVTGTLPDGRPYRADDPHLIGWVHATEVDSFLTAYQRYGSGRLSALDIDRYIADMAIVGRALGGSELPVNQVELTATLAGYRGECRPTPECRDATRFLFAPELPLAALPVYGVVFSAAVALLPGWARSMLLLPVAPGADPVVIRPAAAATMRVLRWAGQQPAG